MTDSTLRSDYFLLEEVLNQMPRTKNSHPNHNHPNNKRAKLAPNHQSQNNSHNNNSNVTKTVRRLVQQAERRGTTLQIMPPIMERHKSNNSWYCAPKDTITWKVEALVYYHHPDLGKKSSLSFQLSENEEHIMDHVVNRCEKEGVPLLGVYKLFLKELPSSAKNPRYVQVQETDTLKKLLTGRTVVEHPTIYCVPDEQVHEFPTTATDTKITEMSSTATTSVAAET
jgi:hypothetical protein